jgi:hypothetical protein
MLSDKFLNYDVHSKATASMLWYLLESLKEHDPDTNIFSQAKEQAGGVDVFDEAYINYLDFTTLITKGVSTPPPRKQVNCPWIFSRVSFER